MQRGLRQLRALRSLPSQPGPDYDRDYFGTAWADVDANGCRTRDDVLARDLRAVEKRDACTVVVGVLRDPYAGRRIAFTKARASAVQVDHVVPLALAWRSGAWAWKAGKRAAFANDPANLLAVDGLTNQRKGDSGPSEWLPPSGGYRCTYVLRYVRVAFLYGVRIGSADRTAIRAVLGDCRRVTGSPSTLRGLSPSLWPRAAEYVHANP